MGKSINVTNSDKRDLWVQLEDDLIYNIKEGTGDALTEEDIAEGYVDYIYYDCYESLSDIRDGEIHDGGMILLRKLYVKYSEEKLIKLVKDFVFGSEIV